jgi:enoyl-CoA hydratase/3-hydroxyacyl-CoA dehydrogenase
LRSALAGSQMVISAICISEIAGAVRNASWFAGLHFIHAVLRTVVEVVCGTKTSHDLVDVLCEFSRKIGKIPIKVMKDRPGFIVNRINAPLQALSSAILDEGKDSAPNSFFWADIPEA